MDNKGSWVEMIIKTGGVVAFAVVLGTLKQAPASSAQKTAIVSQQQQSTSQGQANNNDTQNQPSFSNYRRSRTRAS